MSHRLTPPKLGRSLPVLVLVICLSWQASAQLSGYLSGSYGYNKNPLSNYEGLSDQLAQSYLQLKYVKDVPASRFTVEYVGGLMIFNRFSERNYYEHTLGAGYTARYAKQKPAQQNTEADEENQEEPPFAGNLLEFGAKLGSRHDRSAYREFDNTGAEAAASYTMMAGERASLRFGNQLAYRKYTNLDDLSNLTDIVEVRYGRMPGTEAGVGVFASAGIKHYFTVTYDTTLFESITPGVSIGNGNGKGRGRGNGGSVPGQVKKQNLVNATSRNSYQLTAGVVAGDRWGSCLVEGQILYRYNPGGATRYLPQYVNSSLLTEDIYNDFFSYKGLEGSGSLQQDFPHGLKAVLVFHISPRNYLAPAFDLDAVETAPHRNDLRSLAELTISKTFPLSEGTDLEVSLLTGYVRNQSNDAYNDYSAAALSLSLGIGF